MKKFIYGMLFMHFTTKFFRAIGGVLLSKPVKTAIEGGIDKFVKEVIFEDVDKPKTPPVRREDGKPIEIFFTDNATANEFLGKVEGIMNSDGVVYVEDVYDLVGMSTTFEDSRRGWTKSELCITQGVDGGGLYFLRFSDPIHFP